MRGEGVHGRIRVWWLFHAVLLDTYASTCRFRTEPTTEVAGVEWWKAYNAVKGMPLDSDSEAEDDTTVSGSASEG